MNVLLATDGSDDARAALDLLAGLRWTPGDRAWVVTVVPDFALLSGRIDDELEVWRHGLLDEEMAAAGRFVGEAEERLKPLFGTVETRVYTGGPAREILAAAAEAGADLIVVGTCGRSPVHDWLVGSVSKLVAEKASCSVLVVRPGAASPSRVLLGYDGSPQAQAALEWVSRLPFAGPVEVEVVSVHEGIEMPAAGPSVILPIDYRSSANELAEQHRLMLEAAGQQAVKELERKGLTARASLRSGSASANLLEAAEELHADLVVLGAHKREGWVKDLLGNTARRVVQRAPCSVLVARSGEEPPSQG